MTFIVLLLASLLLIDFSHTAGAQSCNELSCARGLEATCNTTDLPPYINVGNVSGRGDSAIKHQYACEHAPSNITGINPDASLAPYCIWNQAQRNCTECAAVCRGSEGYSLWQFVVAVLLVMVGNGMGRPVTATIFSKLLGPTPQGTMSGFLVASAALGRMAAPVVGVALFEWDDLHTSAIAWVCISLVLAILCGIILLGRALDPGRYYR